MSRRQRNEDRAAVLARMSVDLHDMADKLEEEVRLLRHKARWLHDMSEQIYGSKIPELSDL